ncbi:MAG: glutamate racemase [Ruminococcaceae bacterium]|nr:glutamate racemase [Oscillospiraceae bacterium]
MNNNAIGVFDSGLGGLSAVKQMLKAMPNENIIYFGDTGRVPYGNRSKDTIRRYAMQDANFLLKNNVKMVIAACGTVSSVAPDLESVLKVPYTGVVLPTCFTALKESKNGKVGVIGTTATINSHSYKTRINQKNPSFEVFEQDCPLFVPLVENGFIDRNDPVVKLIVERYMSNLKNAGVDTVILGCTHYPILKDAIADYMGKDVLLIDSGKETALYTKKVLSENGLTNTSNEIGNAQFFVSDTPDNFEKIATLFLEKDMNNKAQQINIEEY